MKCALSVVMFLWTAKVSSESPPTFKSIPGVDYLIQTLGKEYWSDDEACRKTTLRVLNGVKNDTLWATSIWDSMQPPMGVFFGSGVSLGSYDQCLRSPWSSEISTQYCLVEVKIRKSPRHLPREFEPHDSADVYLNTLSRTGKPSNNFVIGVCMAAVCTPSSIASFYRHVLRTTHFSEPEWVRVDPEDCQRQKPETYPQKFYAFWSLVGVLVLVVVISTTYTLRIGIEPSSDIDAIAESFSVVRNWKDLLEVSSTDVRVIHGMKFMSMVLVVLLHQLLLPITNPNVVINSLDVEKVTEGWIGQGLAHIDLAVDTFFAISGLLFAKSLLPGRHKNLLRVLFRRYIRLIGVMAMVIFYFMSTAQFTASGPIWLKTNSVERAACEDHWWRNFLMFTTDLSATCLGLSWYVSCDFHLAILAVALYWIFRKNQKAGVVAFFAVGCGSSLNLIVKAYIKRAPLFPNKNLNCVLDSQYVEMLNTVYIKWQDRAGSYLVGVATGWLMTKYKPSLHRNTISKKTSLIITAASIYTMFMVSTTGYWLSEGRMEVAVAIATSRVIWAAAICGLIGACEYGSVPVISDFLGSAVFAPLSKLSYGIYLTHYLVIKRNLHVTRTLVYFDMFNMIIDVLGAVVVSTVVSLVLYMLVEAPCMNLSNYYLSEKRVMTDRVNGKVFSNEVELSSS